MGQKHCNRYSSRDRNLKNSPFILSPWFHANCPCNKACPFLGHSRVHHVSIFRIAHDFFPFKMGHFGIDDYKVYDYVASDRRNPVIADF